MRWKKAALIISAIMLLLAGFVAFVLPGIVKNTTVHRVENATARKLGIGGISINPFTWTIEVRDLRLSECGGGEVFAAFSSVRIAVSPLSLYRRVPIIASARITSPRLRIVRVGANAYNFSDLLKWLPRHPRLSLNNLTITNGSIDFIDQGLPVGKRHELRHIELAVPFVTTIPYLADHYITPRLSAVVNGSPLHVEGKLRPFPRAVEASATVELQDASIPIYLAYFPGKLPVLVESGRMSAKVTVNYRASQKENPELAFNGTITLTRMKVSDQTGAPFLALTRLDAVITRALLLAGEFDLSSFHADGLEVFLSCDKRGGWSHRRLAGGGSPGTAPPRKMLVSVKEARLRNGRLHFFDSVPPGGFAADLEGISVDMRDYSTTPGKQTAYTLTFTTKRGEKGSLKGEFTPLPLATSSVFELTGMSLEAYYPYLASVLGAKVKGNIDVSAHIDFDGPGGLRLDKISVQARQLTMPFGKREGITLEALSIDGGKFSRKENLLEVVDVTLRDGDLRFSRDRNGALRPLFLLYEGGKGATNGMKAATPALRYRIEHISGAGMAAVFADEMLAERPSFAFKNIAFSLEKLSGPPFGPIPFRVSGAYGKGGLLRLSGSISPTPWKLKGDVTVQRIPLADFAPYFPENLNMVVAAGKVDARLAVSLATGGNRLTGTFSGSAGIRSLHGLDAEGHDLLKWDSLQMDKMKVSFDPDALDIGGVALSRFYSRIIVGKDGRLNFQGLYTRKPEGEEKDRAAGGKKGIIRIGMVTMHDGTFIFTDHHVKGGYSTTLFNMEGRISGLSSEEDLFADVDLRGNLENQSALRISGQINPLRHELFADLKVSFTDIELPRMTPYSGTYLGYEVDKGRLFLDSKYRIENRTLDSENKVFIDQLNLGKRIESNKATSLPVLLAIALLKDRKGEIHLDLPVSGRTDDPQFSVWRVVLAITKNLFATAANSPFTLLQSMFSGKEDLSSVGFAYGSAELSIGERDKILKLSTVLDDRPALKITAAGFVDRERDDEGYRNELLLKKMRAEKFLDMVKEKKNQPGDSPDKAQITPNEYAGYLKAVYSKENFPKPRNIFGLIKALPPAEMKKLILANTVVGDQQLRGLAEARAASVVAFLVKQGKIDPARVSQKIGDIYRAPAKGGEPGSRVEFEVAAE